METIHRDVFVHLSGGLRSDFLDREGFTLFPAPHGAGLRVTGVPSSEYMSVINSFGLRWIGLEEVANFDGIEHRLWDTFTYGVVKGLPWNDRPAQVASHWSGVSKALIDAGDHEGHELARKISFQVQASNTRLQDVSNAYGRQLEYVCRKNIGEDQRFSNFDLLGLISASHGFLSEMATLRDFLAAFLATKVFEIAPIQYMSSLRKLIAKENIHHPLAEEILDVSAKAARNPWLWQLSKLRNHIAHVAPIHHFDGADFLSVRKVAHPYNVELRAVSFEIPADPTDVGSRRADALDQFHELLVWMEKFAADVALASGISPKQVLLDESNILSLEQLGVSDR